MLWWIISMKDKNIIVTSFFLIMTIEIIRNIFLTRFGSPIVILWLLNVKKLLFLLYKKSLNHKMCTSCKVSLKVKKLLQKDILLPKSEFKKLRSKIVPVILRRAPPPFSVTYYLNSPSCYLLSCHARRNLKSQLFSFETIHGDILIFRKRISSK